ncbi:MAG TPA: PAS domain S-box protein [Verrucomicrobiae bacterium]|nr:PAS domain S-box protein [Verrucomicrobiae bacterium]
MDPKALRKRQRTEQVLHERTSLLQLQQVIAAAANEASTVEEAMEATLDLVCSYAGWPMAHALFVGEGGHHRLVFTGVWHGNDRARSGPSEKFVDAKSLICTNNLAAEVLKTGKPAWTADIAQRCNCEWAKVAKEAGLGAALAFPVWVGKETVAVLEFFLETFAEPDEHLLQVLNYVGTQLGRTIERQRAGEALRGTEQRFRSLVENTSDIVTILDDNGVIRYESPSIERVLGYTPEELVGKNAFDLVHPEDRERVLTVFQQVMEEPGQAARIEFRYRHQDGSWRTLEAVGKSSPDKTQAAEVIVNSRDVTERKQMEETLRRNEQRLREAQAVGRIGDWEFDVPTRQIWWSRQTFVLFGLDPAEGSPTYEKLLSYLTPEDAPRLERLVQRAIETGQGFEADLHFCLPNGKDFHQFCVCIPVKDEAGRVTKLRGIGQDITERKRAETALADSEYKYRALVEQSSDSIIATDGQWNIRFVNTAACQMLGYTEEELLRLNMLDTHVPEDLEIGERRRQELHVGQTLRFERNVRRKDGTSFPAEVIVCRIEEGRFQGILRDVTDRKRAEESLRLQSSALEAAANGIVITDRDGTIRWVNPAFTTLTGYTREDAIGQSPRILQSGQQDNRVYAELWRTITSGQVWRGEMINRRKDGSLYTEGMTITPVHNAAGAITHFIAVKQDITQWKRADEALRASEEKYRGLFEGMREGFALCEIICDAHGAPRDFRYLEVNSAFEQILGVKCTDAVGKTAREIFPQVEDYWIDTYGMVALTGASTHFENYLQALDKYFEVTAFSPKRGQFAAVFMDITERKKTEGTLQETNRHLERALTELKTAEQQIIQQERLGALGTMASGIAHDFNNALAAILGFSELLLYKPDCLDDREKARRYIEMMNTAAQDAGDVVNRLREFYRHREEGEVFIPVDINRLVEDATSLTEPKWKAQAEASGVSITVQHDLQEVPRVAGNAANLREMLTNLIFNAVDAMPHGGTITIRTRRDDDHVVLEVADTGTGMTEEVRRRCLEPFFSTKGERGTGLGLSMVYGILQRHEGEIDIQTELGRGTTFVIRLPHHASPVPQSPEHNDPSVTYGPSLRVLIVDDEPLTRKVIGEYLKFDGHTIELAGSGGEGLDKFSKDRFDLVIVDRAMPDMSGDQVAGTIKAFSPATPIIMLTGFGSMMEAADDKPANVDLVVGKPVTIADLRGAMTKVTRQAAVDSADIALEEQLY